ncbi:MAG: hypothetical protein JSW34_06410 [Candidatus Zixiibacteriota bacterium]|nr:MAG: hypothetical protein JSW34_06410 [candidate division Zixibacteria bacterium]
MKKLLIIVLIGAFVLSFGSTFATGRPEADCYKVACVLGHDGWYWEVCCTWESQCGKEQTQCFISATRCVP